MNQSGSQVRSPPTARERRVNTLSLWIGLGGGGVAVLGAVAVALERSNHDLTRDGRGR